MKLFFLSCLIIFSAQAATKSPCDGVSGWREGLCNFAKKNLVHFAWGFEHSLRDYQLAMKLAEEDNVKVDEEVLFAAALVHDMGGFPPYEVQGVDHAVRSTQVCDPILKDAGFPVAKNDAVKKAILTHSYYDPTPPQSPEAIVLHDADTLDFLGAIAIARMMSLAGKEKGFNSPKDAMKYLVSFLDLPNKIHGGAYTKELAKKRVGELKAFIDQIKEETFELGLPLHRSQ